MINKSRRYGVKGFTNMNLAKPITELDEVAYRMEVKWGVGALPTLVPQDLAAKFWRALDKLNDAIDTNDFDAVKSAAENMKKGWLKLDDDATKNGQDAIPDFIKLKCQDGVEYWLVETETQASRLTAKFPHMASSIITHDLVADMLQRSSVVTKTRPITFAPKTVSEVILDDALPW